MDSHLPISGNLEELDVASILMLMNHQALDGKLKISTETYNKTVWLENGCIIFAQSSLLEDSLGSFLLRRRIIDADGFKKSSAHMEKKNIRRGRALLELGLISAGQLWEEVSAHLRAIVFSLFALQTGTYDIAAKPKSETENIVLNMPVPETILEGIRQISDPSFIESRFKENMLLFPAGRQNYFPTLLKPYESHVLSLVREATPLAEITARSELLGFDTLKIVYGLLKIGLLCDRPQPSRQPTPNPANYVPTTFTSFEDTLTYYNGKFEYIYRVLSKEIGPVAQSILLDAITAIMESLPACFHNLEITADGRIDAQSTLKSIWYENFEEHSNEFLRGLEEILYAEIYAVKRHLGKEHEKTILQWIREPGN
ncbi:MAG: DUF4388 domain-containing protein [Candidatus Aminicenantes bacterium]|nr:DUF4388 domain-containing protein [Candidatus Aminicenantes bacterium]